MGYGSLYNSIFVHVGWWLDGWATVHYTILYLFLLAGGLMDGLLFTIQSNILSRWLVGRWVIVHYTIQYFVLLAGGPVGYCSLYNPIFCPVGWWAPSMVSSSTMSAAKCCLSKRSSATSSSSSWLQVS